jgi:hypothetical protein
MNYEYLHEVEQLEICSPVHRPITELAPIFRKLGFTFHDDIVSLDRQERVPPWQHSSIVEIEVLCGGEEVFGFDEGEWDTILIKYLFASLPFELTDKFVEIAFLLSKEFSLPLMQAGATIDEMWLRQRLTWIRQELLDQTGEEAGSEGLAIQIHSTYPRR